MSGWPAITGAAAPSTISRMRLTLEAGPQNATRRDDSFTATGYCRTEPAGPPAPGRREVGRRFSSPRGGAPTQVRRLETSRSERTRPFGVALGQQCCQGELLGRCSGYREPGSVLDDPFAPITNTSCHGYPRAAQGPGPSNLPRKTPLCFTCRFRPCFGRLECLSVRGWRTWRVGSRRRCSSTLLGGPDRRNQAERRHLPTT